MKCTVEGCDKDRRHSKYYCPMHYARIRVTGTLAEGPKARAPLEARFWKKVQKADIGCWMWKGGLTGRGYGIIGEGNKGGKHLLAHRVSYVLHMGQIPPGMLVMHSCDNPACVNPDHLSLGTSKDNTQDALRKKRLKTIFLSGERNPLARLKEADVRFIRQNPQMMGTQLAAMFNISVQQICSIRKGRAWKGIK